MSNARSCTMCFIALAAATLAIGTRADAQAATSTAPPAAEPEATTPPATHQTETVVVTATRGERSAADVPASVTVVDREQIQVTPAQSLDDILRTVPSITMTTSASYQQHPTSNGISMRGLGAVFDIRTLVLLDGVPLNHPFSGFVQWMRVPMESVDRVEIVRGGGSSLWGNYAMGGVINVITREPERSEVGLEAGGGQFGTTRTNAYASYAGSDAFKLNLNANVFNTDGFNRTPAALRTPLDVPVAFEAHNVQGTVRWKADPTLSGYARVNYHDNAQVLGTRLQQNDQREWDFAAGATKALGGSSLDATAFFSHSRFHTDNTQPNADRTTEFLQNAHETPVSDFGLSLQWTTRLADFVPTASLGADYHFIDGEDVAAIYDDTGARVRTDVGRGKQQLVGVFAQASFVPVQRLEVLASARYERWTNFDGFDGNPGGQGAVADRSADAFSPRVSVRFELARELALRAAGYTAFRAPNLDSLYRGFAAGGFLALPNPQLEPERLVGAEAGFDLALGPVRAQVTGFANRITNLVTTRVLDPSQFPAEFSFATQNVNAGRSKSLGAEASVDWALTRALSANVGYTFTIAEITDNPNDPTVVGLQLAGVPRDRVSAGLAYAAPYGVKASARLRWLEKTYGDTLHTFPQDQHTVIDASLSVPVAKGTELFANVENLLDNTYIGDNNGFSPPQLGTPRTVFAGVRATFR
jgi:outer membrane receptor protein involved in Fe transport